MAPFVECLRDYGVIHVLTSPYSPSSNGAVERVNRTFTQLLRMLCKEGSQWVDHLPRVLHIYNNTMHSETNMSPTECLLKVAHTGGAGPKGRPSPSSFWEQAGGRFRAFQVGELVGLRIQHMGDSTINKLLDRYAGPYRVLKVNPNEVTYQIQELSAGAGKVVRCHYRHMRKWIEPPPYLLQHPLYERWYRAQLQQGNGRDNFGETVKKLSFPVPGPDTSPAEGGKDHPGLTEIEILWDSEKRDPLRIMRLSADE